MKLPHLYQVEIIGSHKARFDFYDEFIGFQEGTDLEKLIGKERYETVSSLDEGIERMAKEKYVFLWTKETMDYLLQKNCSFSTLKGILKYIKYETHTDS